MESYWERIAILNEVIREDLTEKVTLQKRIKGKGRGSLGVHTRQQAQPMQRPCSRNRLYAPRRNLSVAEAR